MPRCAFHIVLGRCVLQWMMHEPIAQVGIIEDGIPKDMDHYRSSKPKNAAPVNKRHSASKGSYRRGEVYFAKAVSFDGSDGSKDRPVICLSGSGDVMRCLKCTSSDTRGLYEILDYTGAGLDHATYVDPRPFNLPKSKIARYLGELNEVDYCNLELDELRAKRLSQLFLDTQLNDGVRLHHPIILRISTGSLTGF